MLSLHHVVRTAASWSLGEQRLQQGLASGSFDLPHPRTLVGLSRLGLTLALHHQQELLGLPFLLPGNIIP